ncbi:phosphotransferase [Streptomyces sp. AHA2]|uniref:phosphotransferase n=1 Tax=Streptomyces sp. AHA2 TaxID=3064526 RepID=UPI002FE4294A
MTLPAGLELPSFNPFDKQELRISQAAIPEDDRVFLRKRWSELRDQFEGLRFETPKGPVHGDAHVQNLMVNDHGGERPGRSHPDRLRGILLRSS